MARINSQEAIDHFIGFVVSASIAALLVILAIWRREPWINRVRLPTLIPLAVSASVPAQLHVNLKSFFSRAWRDSEALARVRDAYDALALAVSSSTHPTWIDITLLVWYKIMTDLVWFGLPGNHPHRLGIFVYSFHMVHEATVRKRHRTTKHHQQQSPQPKAQQRLLLRIPMRSHPHVDYHSRSRSGWP